MLVPGYYFRTENYGQITTNYSGAGSDVATEREMMKNFICQNLTTLTEEYKFAGYRFDLMGLIANPNAIAKCKKFVKDEMPRQLNIVMAESMDESARLLSNYNLTYSIIGTEKTAELYNLNVLKEHIEDDKDNNRRFIVIGDGQTQPTGKDKTSIVVFINDRPGVLMEIIQVFVKYHINMTQINSKMVNNMSVEQAVFIDFEGHKQDENVANLLNDISKACNCLRVIGSYSTF